MENGSTYDRIMTAQQEGNLSLRESLLLRAKLLFAPQLLIGSCYAPRGGEAVVREELTGFYKDVHRGFPELSLEERLFLKGLSRDLKVIIEQREREEGK